MYLWEIHIYKICDKLSFFIKTILTYVSNKAYNVYIIFRRRKYDSKIIRGCFVWLTSSLNRQKC